MQNGTEQAVCSTLEGASPGPGVLSELGWTSCCQPQIAEMWGQMPIGTGLAGKGMRLWHSAKPNGLSLGFATGAIFCVDILPRPHLQ